jgi:hypothetical protein
LARVNSSDFAALARGRRCDAFLRSPNHRSPAKSFLLTPYNKYYVAQAAWRKFYAGGGLRVGEVSILKHRATGSLHELFLNFDGNGLALCSLCVRELFV